MCNKRLLVLGDGNYKAACVVRLASVGLFTDKMDFIGCRAGRCESEFHGFQDYLRCKWHGHSLWGYIELASGEQVESLQPQFDEIQKWSGRGVIVTGLAPQQSGFDFYSRFFCPQCGINEDPVCGSAHCALGPYWATKLGKTHLVAHQASKRGGKLVLQVVEDGKRILLQGEAVKVMSGMLTA